MQQELVNEKRKIIEIFLKKGQKPGNPLEDWVEAEKEILAEHQMA